MRFIIKRRYSDWLGRASGRIAYEKSWNKNYTFVHEQMIGVCISLLLWNKNYENKCFKRMIDLNKIFIRITVELL